MKRTMIIPQEVINEFLLSYKQEGKSPHTLRGYSYELYSLMEEFEGKELSDIQSSDIRNYLLKRERQGVSPTTLNRAIACYKAFFKFLHLHDYIPTNPMQWVKSVKLQKGRMPEYLTVEEMNCLLDAPQFEKKDGLRDYTILMLFYNTGIRVEELCRLNRSDLRLPERGDGVLKVLGKGDKLRLIPLNLSMKKLLDKYLATRTDNKPPLFLNRYGERFTLNGVRKLINKYLKKVGIPKRGCHLLRHTFATHSYNVNPNLMALKEILGHQSIRTTEVYTHLNLEDLKKQTQELPANKFR